MVLVKYGDVPEYLRSSAFYLSMNGDDADSDMEIPAECFKGNEDVFSVHDLGHLLQTMRFWGLDTIPPGACIYCCTQSFEDWKEVTLKSLGTQTPIYQDLQSIFSKSADKDRLSSAIECGRMELIQCLIATPDISTRLGTNVTKIACKYGRLDILKLLHDHGFYWDEDSTSEAAKGGHLECLIYAREQGCRWDESVYAAAAFEGHINCIEFAFANGLEPHEDLFLYAIDGSQMECLQFGFEHDFPYDSTLTTRAVEANNAECLAFVLENGCDVEVPFASDAACKGGRLECLRVLVDFGILLTTRCAAQAADGDHLECLHLLRERGCPWDSLTPEWAATKGHVEVLRYALDNNCPFKDTVTNFAAQAGSLPCLKYLLEERHLELSSAVFGAAFVRAHIDCVRYLLERGCPCADFVFRGEADWMYYGMHRKSAGCSLDEPMLQCIQCAEQHGWQHNKNLVDYILEYQDELPLCVEHMRCEGWV